MTHVNAPRFAVVALDRFEREVRLRMPFRFGAVTVRSAPQAFVRATIRLLDGREFSGWTAELLVPKWFDKNPDRTNDENIDDLRRALALAADAYTAEAVALPAFGHASTSYSPLLAEGARQDLNPLLVSFGAALADRAILAALCRATRMNFAAAVRANLPGIDVALTPDLHGFALDDLLAGLAPVSTIFARHTVGLVDPLGPGDASKAPDDGLPATLSEVIERYGHRYFKLKLSGRVDDDLARLVQIAAVLEALPEFAVTLDGNEQFADVQSVREFWRAVAAEPRLTRLAEAVIYLEQPLPRAIALAADVAQIATTKPLLIDESDATLDAFPQARRVGYTGVSSKNCKGPYKSLLNAARCARWNATQPGHFISGEDLTAQAGLAVQQDLALVGVLGLAHVERNGHHYVAGFAGQGAPLREQRAFAAAHRDLYDEDAPGARLAIRDGRITFASLDAPGFGGATEPDIASLAPMPSVAAAISTTGT